MSRAPQTPDHTPGNAPAAHDGARKVASVRGVKGDPSREARIKAALKANIARRKAQAQSRADNGAAEDGSHE